MLVSLRSPRLLIAIAFILGVIAASQVQAKIFDTDFGNSGVAELDVGFVDSSTEMVTASNGSIFVLGTVYSELNKNVLIAKFTPEGILDTSFGGFGPQLDGTVVIDHELKQDTPGAITLQADGKIVVAFESKQGYPRSLVVQRYNSSGSLDVSFGDLGTVVEPKYSGNSSNGGAPDIDIAIVDDKVVVRNTIQLYRFLSDGSPDVLFGEEGILYPAGLFDDKVNFRLSDLAVVGLQMYVIGPFEGEYENETRIVAINDAGELDSSFGDNGILATPQNILMKPSAFEVHGNMITAAGEDRIIRMDFDGILDGNFSNNGLYELDVDGEITDIVVQSGGKIVASVAMEAPDENEFTVVRLTKDGKLDSTFSHSTFGFADDGWFRASFGNRATARKLITDYAGKILVLGDYEENAGFGSNENILLMQLDTTPDFNPNPNPGGGGGRFPGGKTTNNPTHGGGGGGNTIVIE